MFKYQIKKFIKENHPNICNIINANIPSQNRIEMPKFKIAMTLKQSKILYYDIRKNNFYTLDDSIKAPSALAWYYPIRIDYNIEEIKKIKCSKIDIINIMCHEIFHVINIKNLPPISESLYRQTKPHAIQFFRQFYYSDSKINQFIKYFYEPQEFWAFAFADACTNGPIQSIGKQFLPKIFNVKFNEINKNIENIVN